MGFSIVDTNPWVYLSSQRPRRKSQSLDKALDHSIKLSYFSGKARCGAYGWS